MRTGGNGNHPSVMQKQTLLGKFTSRGPARLVPLCFLYVESCPGAQLAGQSVRLCYGSGTLLLYPFIGRV